MATFSGRSYVGQFDASKLIGSIRDGAHQGVGKAGAALQRHYKLMLNKPGPNKTRHTGDVYTQKSGPSKGQTETIRASAPGEPPRYRTRDLLNSVQYEYEGDTVVRVGTHLKYGLILELGLGRLKGPRPWLRLGLVQMQNEISRIILASIKKGK